MDAFRSSENGINDVLDEFIRGENDIDDRFTDPCMHLYCVKMRSTIALTGLGCIYIE